jgi:hypothetical protein
MISLTWITRGLPFNLWNRFSDVCFQRVYRGIEAGPGGWLFGMYVLTKGLLGGSGGRRPKWKSPGVAR